MSSKLPSTQPARTSILAYSRSSNPWMTAFTPDSVTRVLTASTFESSIDMARLATRHQPGVDVDLLVDPVAPGVPDVRREARPRGQRPPFHDPRLNQGPRAMADRRDGLSGLEEGARELDRVVARPQDVGVRDAAWKDEGVVVVRVRLGHGSIDRERVGLVEVLESLHLPALRRDQLGLGAGIPDKIGGRPRR